MAFTNIGKAELKKGLTDRTSPYLLSMTLHTDHYRMQEQVSGYTTLREPTAHHVINITVNGIPMNDAESHNLFWVNMPDVSSSVKMIPRDCAAQVRLPMGQVPSGASVNMQTEGASMKPYAEFNGSYGSFNTHKAKTVKVGTGLLNNHWTRLTPVFPTSVRTDIPTGLGRP